MVRLDLNQAEIDIFRKALGEAINSGNFNPSQIKRVQDLNLKISQELGLPVEIPVSHYDRYKEFIRDKDRLSNEQSLIKYGIPITQLITEVDDFVTEIKAGNKPTPRERVRPTIRPEE